MMRPHGFTLVELVIALAILGVLAMMSVPLLEMTAQREKEVELRSALRQIRGAIDEYRQAVRDKRIQTQADASGYPPSLEILVRGERDITSPDGKLLYFLRRIPRDPFHPDPALPPEATWAKRSYASPPDFPREGDDLFDIASTSSRIGLNGVPYKEW